MKTASDRFFAWLARQEVGTRFTRNQARKEMRCSDGDKGWHEALVREQIRMGRITSAGRWYTIIAKLPQVPTVVEPSTTQEEPEPSNIPIPNQRTAGAGDVARAIALFAIRGRVMFTRSEVTEAVAGFYGLPLDQVSRISQHLRYIDQLEAEGFIEVVVGGGYAVTIFGYQRFEEAIWGLANAEKGREEAESRLLGNEAVRDTFRATHLSNRRRQDRA
jgi:hypothetical protein